ncbi:MAG: hypothetical protein R3F53_13575 [Gammaproteobacteria bacterium]
MLRRCCTGFGLLAALAAPIAAGVDISEVLIQGTITVTPELVQHIEPQDRLIIKLFHPGENGVELDAKNQIFTTFTLPLTFKIAPSISMSGDTKYKTYSVEVLTDKDLDFLSAATGELMARTPEPVALGSSGLILELNTLHTIP